MVLEMQCGLWECICSSRFYWANRVWIRLLWFHHVSLHTHACGIELDESCTWLGMLLLHPSEYMPSSQRWFVPHTLLFRHVSQAWFLKFDSILDSFGVPHDPMHSTGMRCIWHGTSVWVVFDDVWGLSTNLYCWIEVWTTFKHSREQKFVVQNNTFVNMTSDWHSSRHLCINMFCQCK